MNCVYVQSHLIELADGTLAPADSTAMHVHIAQCETCRTQWLAESHWRSAASRVPVPEIRADFAAQVFARARAAHPAAPRHGFRTGFITAMAASLALWVTAGLWTGTQSVTDNNQLPVVRVALHQAGTIDLVFQSPEDFGVATIAMQLPENFEIAGQPGVRELTFESPIKRGNNRLAIPVVAIAPGAGDFLAKIQHLDKQKEFRVRLDTSNPHQNSQSAPIRITT